MRRPRVPATVAAALLLVALTSAEVQSRGSSATERPWAAEHVEGLPNDIRRDIEAHAKACGNAPSAAHYFSVSIEASGLRFRAQHFEDFACERRSAVCRPEGCHHEVFVDNGRHQRLVFSVYTRELKLTSDGGIAEIEIINGGGARTFLWNGRRFAPTGHFRKMR